MKYVVDDCHRRQFVSNQTLVVQEVWSKRVGGEVGGPLSDVCVSVFSEVLISVESSARCVIL